MLTIITNREYIHKDEPHYTVKVSPTISWIAPKISLILPVSSLQKSAKCWPLLIPPKFAYALTSSTMADSDCLSSSHYPVVLDSLDILLPKLGTPHKYKW